MKHNLTDEDVLAIQIQANALRPETTAIEYARQIKRIMAAITARQGRDATLADVSNVIHKNPAWIGRHSLLGLRREIQTAVERGEIPLGSAYVLAKLPGVQQMQFLELAKISPTREFAPVVTRLLKQIQEAAKQGKLHDYCKDFEPVAHLALEGSARRVPGAPPWRPGPGQGRLHRRRWTAGTGASQWALNLDEESVRRQRETILSRTRASLLKRRAEPCDD